MEASIAPCVCENGAGFLISSKKDFYKNILAVRGSYLQSCKVPDLKQGEAYLVSFGKLLQRSSSSVVVANVDTFCSTSSSSTSRLLSSGKRDVSGEQVGLAKVDGCYGVLFSQLEQFFDSVSDSPFFASLPDSVDFDIPTEDQCLFLPLTELVRASSRPLVCIPIQSIEAYFPLPSPLSTPARLDYTSSAGKTTVYTTSSYEGHETSTVESTVERPVFSKMASTSRVLVQTAPLRRTFSSPLPSHSSAQSSPATSEPCSEQSTAITVDLPMPSSRQEGAKAAVQHPSQAMGAGVRVPSTRAASLQRSTSSSLPPKSAVPRPLTRAKAVQGETHIHAINQQRRLWLKNARGGCETGVQPLPLPAEGEASSAEDTPGVSSTSTVFAVMSSGTESSLSASQGSGQACGRDDRTAASSPRSDSSGDSSESSFSPFSSERESVRREDVDALCANLFGDPLSQPSTLSSETDPTGEAEAKGRGRKRRGPSPPPAPRPVRSSSVSSSSSSSSSGVGGAKRAKSRPGEDVSSEASLPPAVQVADWLDLSQPSPPLSLPPPSSLPPGQSLSQQIDGLVQRVEDDDFANLHMPFPVPGRVRESVYLLNQLLSALRLGRGKLVYLSGLPGGGKSQTAQVTVRYLQRLLLARPGLPRLHWVRCSAMGHHVRQDIFEALHKLCGGARRPGPDRVDEVKRFLLDTPRGRPPDGLPWTSWELDQPHYAAMGLFTRSLADVVDAQSRASPSPVQGQPRTLPAPLVAMHTATSGRSTAAQTAREVAPMVVLVLEEIDCLSQAVFHELEELTARGRLVVIGSGNTVGAVEPTPSLGRQTSGKASEPGDDDDEDEEKEMEEGEGDDPARGQVPAVLAEKVWDYPSACSLVFAAYSVEDMCTIATHRVGDLFHPKAVECLARQVAKNHKGDVRKLLAQMVAAMKNALANHRASQAPDPPSLRHFVTIKDVMTTNAPSYDQLQRQTIHALTSDLLLLLAALFQWFGNNRSFVASEVPRAYEQYARKFNLNERFTVGIKKGLDLLLDSTAIKVVNAGIGENKRYCVSVDPKVLLSAPCFGVEHGMIQNDFKRHLDLIQQQQELEREEEQQQQQQQHE